MTFGPGTRLASLIGYPVEHSYSPLIHNEAYRIQGLDAVYLARSVPPGTLSDAVAGLRGFGFMGANVTIPHKESIVPLLDDLSNEARAVGAVNTVVCRRRDDGRVRLLGENTDVSGFLTPLVPYRSLVQDRYVVIVGSGGAARAALYAVLTALRPARVAVVARRPERARHLVSHFGGTAPDVELEAAPIGDAGKFVAEASLVINATPVGMYPDVQRSPLADPSVLAQGQIVYDLVYNPVRTRLLEDAAARGATPLNGLEMLLGQAAAAHTLWTGLNMPVDEIRETLLRMANRS